MNHAYFVKVKRLRILHFLHWLFAWHIGLQNMQQRTFLSLQGQERVAHFTQLRFEDTAGQCREDFTHWFWCRWFVVVHPCSTFSDCRQLSTSLNAEVQKNGKNWGFSPPEGDRLNRSRRPQKSKFAKNCGFWPPEADRMNTLRWNLTFGLL